MKTQWLPIRLMIFTSLILGLMAAHCRERIAIRLRQSHDSHLPGLQRLSRPRSGLHCAGDLGSRFWWYRLRHCPARRPVSPHHQNPRIQLHLNPHQPDQLRVVHRHVRRHGRLHADSDRHGARDANGHHSLPAVGVRVRCSLIRCEE